MTIDIPGFRVIPRRVTHRCPLPAIPRGTSSATVGMKIECEKCGAQYQLADEQRDGLYWKQTRAGQSIPESAL